MLIRQPLGLRTTITALSALFSVSAMAAPGDHIRAGEAVIIPDLDVGFEYRTNAYRIEQDVQGAGAIRIAPGLAITADGPDVSFSLQGEYEARKFVYLQNNVNLGAAERQQRISDLDRFNAFDVSAEFLALKQKPVSFHISDAISLRNNPNDSLLDSDDPYATQFRNTLQGGLALRPRPALEFDLYGMYRYGRFFVPDIVPDRENFNITNAYGPRLDLKYTFLPRTAFVFESQFNWHKWQDVNPTGGTSTFTTPDSTNLRLMTGIQGRISERLRVVGKVGYGAAWYEQLDNLAGFKGLLFALQTDYRMSESHDISLGYRRNFIDSFFTNTAAHNSLYARWNGQYGRRVTSRLEYGIRFEDYDGGVDRNDIVNRAQAGVQVMAAEWMRVGLDVGWINRTSQDDLVEYNAIRVLAGTTFTY